MIKFFILILISGSCLFAADSGSKIHWNNTRQTLVEQATQYSDSLAAEKPEGYVSPMKAALYSAVLPGAGEYLTGSYWKAALFAGVEIAAWTSYFIYTAKGDHHDLVMRDFGDQHWSEKKYWSKVYDLAQIQQNAGNSEFADLPDFDVDPATSILTEYDAQVVDALRIYENALPGFTHSLPATHTQQYYEMIYKYLHQFGNGWDDALFDVTYDGYQNKFTNNILRYRDLRNTTDKLYDYATTATMVTLVNHVASALDAAFTAKINNRQLHARFIMGQKQYFDEQVSMYGLAFSW